MLALKKEINYYLTQSIISILPLCRSDTESAEDTTTGKDETDTKDNVNDEKKDEKKSTASGMVNTFTNLFAAMKKSVKKPKDGKYAAETPESEMKVSFLKIFLKI